MKTACCQACGSEEAERRVHLDAMDEFHEHFLSEHRHLTQECKRIEELFKDVVWYNFETVACAWEHPWPETLDDSNLELHAQHYEIVKSRGGRYAEKAKFPYYYAGRVRDAPKLPPLIVLEELKLARDAVREAEVNCLAPYEWAPGGRLYEKMMRESDGVRAYQQLSSKDNTVSDDRHGAAFKDGIGLRLGDPMEREATTHTQATPEDLLGRVRGDRSLVRA